MSSKDIYSKYILAYICTFPTKEEILSTNKLISTGVPPERSVGSLKNKTPVELSNGKLITPPDDLIHSYKESTFIVLEIPSVEYLESLISSSDFDKYKKEGTCNHPEENDLKIIVHFSPPEVMKDSRYRQWANSFSPSVSHLVINSRSSCLGLHSPVIMQLQLNQILPNVFPLHRNPGVPFVSFGADIPIEEDIMIPSFTSEYKFEGTTIQSNSAILYHIQPFKEFDSSRRPFVNPKQALSNCQENESILNSLENLNAKFAELNQEKNSASRNHYPSFLFLGTGSSYATGTRNNSAILISLWTQDIIPHFKNTAFRFSHSPKPFCPRPPFLTNNVMQKVPILYILAPQDIISFVKKLSHNFSFDFENILFINNYDLSKKNFDKLPIHKAIKSLQLEQVTVVKVPHLERSFGVALTHKDGWKVVYSGDASPSTNLISIGKNCDLLIHEATLEDGMEERALLTLHSTFSQAIEVGEDMNAKFTILTHFSQRYKKIPFFEENTLREKNVGIAFDCMKVTFEDFPYLRHLYPTLKEMFSEDYSILKRIRFMKTLK
ncbi:Ribonuclease Z [Armadillidium nasatum]|uniref:ribonuclease Z n=1 Tax=Armadillidium nasatum TaxID=96803 RepID=A0A5N5SWX4_9CRUS|nr:Ribonuclease Z [Armadillidium nasatum]